MYKLTVLFATMLIATSFNSSIQNESNPMTNVDMGVISSENEYVMSSMGNSIGNISNNGIVAKSDDWLYYALPNENLVGRQLYKTLENSEERILVLEDDCLFINVLDGWIYYVNNSDGGALYKISTTGTEKKKLTNFRCVDVFTVNDTIYLLNSEDNHIYRISMSDEMLSLVSEVEISEFTIVDDQIFYIDRLSNYSIFSMRTDGSDVRKLSDDDSQSLTIIEDWIYYSNYGDGSKVYRIKSDGSQRELVNEDESQNLLYNDGWIYYTNYSDYGKMYKMRIDGTERTVMTQWNAVNINIIDDTLYYDSLLAESYEMYQVSIDGSNNIKVRE